MASKKLGINKPLSKEDRMDFLKSAPDAKSTNEMMDLKNNTLGRPNTHGDLAKKKTITMYQDDLDNVDYLINRCIHLGMKDKGISGAIRMALLCLKEIEDDKFRDYYNSVR